MSAKKIKKALPQWDCLGRYGYGQGRAVAELGEDEVGQTSVCEDVCPRIARCREKHVRTMDERFPSVSDIVKRTAATAKGAGLDTAQLVVAAMRVAARRDNVEALRIQEGLKRFGIGGSDITDHYVYGQLENLFNGFNKKPADTKPDFILIGASYE